MALALRPSLPDICCIWSDISELLRMTGALGTGAKGSAASPVNSSEYMESLMSHVKACIPKEINSHGATIHVLPIKHVSLIRLQCLSHLSFQNLLASLPSASTVKLHIHDSASIQAGE